ncbi:MAG: 2-succinyl-5-enolpyruvyl-6-hydroxy-3-cyclohexene-1-carboxylic-acid synthase [Kiritimatiellae bacterium]|nr:2-succinyl-5-enolpyruvyl-6-hydroxy-3-cyclohexene-1-carboxylic-acid synthase [Kiritimatiellia bacterium]
MKTTESNHSALRNLQWAEHAIDALVLAGVRHCVICPGARSSALVLAAYARQDALTLSVHYDERGATFFAMGLATGSGRPVAVVTTSGSAVANTLPAVVEASLSHVPLIIISADRPPELRDTSANQAIDQTQILSPHTRWFFDFPCPTDDVNAVRFVGSTVQHAVARATGPDAGPVHLNFMFREPLVPSAEALEPRTRPALGPPPTAAEALAACPGAVVLPNTLAAVAAARRGLVVVGALKGDVERDAVVSLVKALGWPVLADVASGMTCEGAELRVVRHPDLLLRNAASCDTLRPDVVLYVGGPVVSKHVFGLLADTALDAFVRIQSHPRRSDPTQQATHVCVGAIAETCKSFSELNVKASASWCAAWAEADRVVAAHVGAVLGTAELNEFSVGRALMQSLPVSHDLFLSNSMPVRIADMLGVPLDARIHVAANRGASGIDGIVATAAGFAHGRQRPNVLWIGDQALLHDLNSLILLRDTPPTTVVVINNNGGGIFELLPIAHAGDAFERCFAAPHGRTFEHAAKMFELGYEQVDSLEAFTAALKKPIRETESGLIEVCTDRKETASIMRALTE